MDIRHPRTNHEFKIRNNLLQNSLRPENLPFDIQSEYPIILNEASAETSYCMFDANNNIVAHASLWKRPVINNTRDCIDHIGLIGNVATSEEFRGKGLMSQLLNYLEMQALEYQLSCLILWSDLGKFYQKLGYESLGKEQRIFLRTPHSDTLATYNPAFHIDINPHLKEKELDLLLLLRKQTDYTLNRSAKEFDRLLRIPNCDLFTIQQDGRIVAYAIVGKGYDMMGVIHEWGYIVEEAMSYLINVIIKGLNLNQILILAPLATNLDFIGLEVIERQIHPMAWARFLGTANSAHIYKDNLFIWGLDSI